MVAIKDSTQVVNSLFRPIGFRIPDGKKATVEEIKKWKEKEKPNFIQEQSYLIIGGVIATILGAIIGFLGFKKDNKLMKWFGGILTLVGVGSGGTGIVYKAELNSDLKKASLMDELKAILDAEDIKKPELRKALFEKYKNHDRDSLGKTFSEIFNPEWCGKEPVDEKLVDEAGNLNGMISSYHMLRKTIPCIKDKTVDYQTRCSAIDETVKALEYLEDPNAIQPIIDCIKDKSEHYNVRNSAIKALGDVKRENFIELLVSIINDKTEDDGVRREAVGSLSKIKSKEAPKTLLTILKDKSVDKEVRERIISCLFYALDYLDPENCFKVLQDISEDKSETGYINRCAKREIESLKSLLEAKAKSQNQNGT